MKKRIWELDAFRGLCILGMVIVHFAIDLTYVYNIIDWEFPTWFAFVQRWGGVLFLLISGISATLGRRSVRRGLLVLLCGIPVSLVTWVMYKYFHFHKSIVIYFGVLQCLGCCMILWWVCKRLPTWLLAALGSILVAAGLYLDKVVLVNHFWLMPLGFTYPGFETSDYYPLLPYFGFFLLGAVLGRTVYRKKESLLGEVAAKHPVSRALCWCGKQSLWIYLVHQPLLSLICMFL